LSNTNNRTLPSYVAATDSLTVLPGCCVMPNMARHRIGHSRRIGDRGQLENPYTVRESIDQTRRYLSRKPRLADPAHPGQRHQPMISQLRLDLGDLGLAADQAGCRGPQVPGFPSRRSIN
jgi:hypothetical protein